MGSDLRNVDAEANLLGAILFDNGALDSLSFLKPEHFSEPFYGRVFGKTAELVSLGRSADPVVISAALANDERMKEFGGIAHLAELTGRAPPAYLAADYGRMISDFAMRRALIEQTRVIQDAAANDLERDAASIVSEGERQIAEIADCAADSYRLASGVDVIDLALHHAEAFGSAPEYPSGLEGLDKMLGGFQRGELTIIAGRPGMGKSLVGLGLTRNIAISGKGVVYFSLEMSGHSLGLRLACDIAFQRGGYGRFPSGPTMEALSKGRASSGDLEAIAKARKAVGVVPLRIDVRPGLTLTRIEQTTRKQFREWRRQGVDPGPVVVDHLGLIRPERNRSGSKHAETADISRGLAELAKRLNVPVIALCQLNRGVEGRDDKRPGLSDLRQAGELEEDARMVILLHRPAYYSKPPTTRETFDQEAERVAKEDAERNLLRLIVAKNSNGPVGDVEAFVDVSRSAVRDRDAQP